MTFYCLALWWMINWKFSLIIALKKNPGGFKANVISIYYFNEILSVVFFLQMSCNLSCKNKSIIISLQRIVVTTSITFKLHRMSQQNEVKGNQETYNYVMTCFWTCTRLGGDWKGNVLRARNDCCIKCNKLRCVNNNEVN